jgi:hypothetical protein
MSRRPPRGIEWLKEFGLVPEEDFAAMLARFEEKISPEPNSGCWLWDGAINRDGYGNFWLPRQRRGIGAHRLSYILAVGPVPDGLEIDHLCRMRCCVNPEHMEPVTKAENARRGIVGHNSSAKTHCPQGHAYTADNLVKIRTRSRTNRICLTCSRLNRRKYRARRKANAA